MIKNTVNKIINIKEKVSKQYIHGYIIYIIFNILLLNYLLLYFVLNFYNNKYLGVKKDFSSIKSSILETNNEKEKYNTFTYLICVIYIIFSLIFYVLEFFIKFNGTFLSDLYLFRKKNFIDYNVKIPQNNKKNTEIYVTINYIFIYFLLTILGLIKCNIDEYFFYFFSLIIICEINTPLKVFMVFIKIIKKYYKNSYMKKEYNNVDNIKKRDLYFFFCYFIIIRYLGNFSLYEKFNIYKYLTFKNYSEKLSRNKYFSMINFQNYVSPSLFYKDILKRDLLNYMKNIFKFLKKYIRKFNYTFIFINNSAKNILSKFFNILQYILTENFFFFNNIVKEENICTIKTENSELNHGATELKKKEKDMNTSEIHKCVNKKNKKVLHEQPIKRNQIKQKIIHNDNTLCEEENEYIDEPNYFYELSKKEYLKMKRNVNKYNNYYEYFKKNKPNRSEDEYVSTSENENFNFIKRKKRQFQVVEADKNKFIFDNLEDNELSNDNTSKKYFIDIEDEACIFINEDENKRNDNKGGENKKDNCIEKKIDGVNENYNNASIYYPYLKEPSNIDIPNKNKNGDLYNKDNICGENNYSDDVSFKKGNNEICNKRKKHKETYTKNDIKGCCFSMKTNELKKFIHEKGCQSERKNKKEINIENSMERKNMKNIEIYNFKNEKKKKKSIACSDIQNNSEDSLNFKIFNINKKTNNKYNIKNGLKKKNNDIFIGGNEANVLSKSSIFYEVCNQQEKNILRKKKKMKNLKKNLKIFLSNFKRKMEICIFLNMVYKIISLLNILLIFFVKGIYMYINLYYFISKYKTSFFFQKILLTLIQCSFFFLFHLYAYEYKKKKKKY
ncbi:conserved Plasmodium protein, unknown function [Plasmodium gallinaceum]|uniref:Uncharacterized protein n=1 Tax=Plasmodium gallinaceum TaxID=5849 RepID=A0A1J1GPD2_PLAGA|nr:conserved Plasmodium protein, unknown function [Plasmodium gallinaceum]CRG93143.1 conserved Plasmodium protein, unknown function [Plasmodium gallinaceum]